MKKTLAALVLATMTLVGCGDKEATEVNNKSKGRHAGRSYSRHSNP